MGRNELNREIVFFLFFFGIGAHSFFVGIINIVYQKKLLDFTVCIRYYWLKFRNGADAAGNFRIKWIDHYHSKYYSYILMLIGIISLTVACFIGSDLLGRIP